MAAPRLVDVAHFSDVTTTPCPALAQSDRTATGKIAGWGLEEGCDWERLGDLCCSRHIHHPSKTNSSPSNRWPCLRFECGLQHYEYIYYIYIARTTTPLGCCLPPPLCPCTALHSRCSSPLGRPRRDLPMPNGEQQSAGQESSRRGYSQSEEGGGGTRAGGDHLLPPGNFKFIIAFAVIYDLCEISSYIKVNGVT